MAEHDHRRLAVDTFNSTWDLIETEDRTEAQDLDMLMTALASRYHWKHAGEPRNHAMSDWQVSRALAVMGESDLARSFAASSMEICIEHDLDAFMVVFAEEALARALLVGGDKRAAREVLTRARTLAATIADAEDRKVAEADLDELQAKL